MHRIALATIALTPALVFGCGGSGAPDATPSPEATAEARETAATPWALVAGLPDDAYAEIARAVPGFGGVYIGTDSITIDLTDPSLQAEAEEAIGRVFKEFFGRDVFADNPAVRVRQTKIPYLDLYNWRLTLRSALFGPEGGVLGRLSLISRLGIDDRAKKIAIGVPEEENIRKVEAILDEHGIPREAVEFHIAPFLICCERPEGYPEYTLP